MRDKNSKVLRETMIVVVRIQAAAASGVVVCRCGFVGYPEL